MLNVGVIGTGMIGQDHIRRLTDVLPGASVVAVSDVDRDRAPPQCAQLGGSLLSEVRRLEVHEHHVSPRCGERLGDAASKRTGPAGYDSHATLDVHVCLLLQDTDLPVPGRRCAQGRSRTGDSLHPTNQSITYRDALAVGQNE